MKRGSQDSTLSFGFARVLMCFVLCFTFKLPKKPRFSPRPPEPTNLRCILSWEASCCCVSPRSSGVACAPSACGGLQPGLHLPVGWGPFTPAARPYPGRCHPSLWAAWALSSSRPPWRSSRVSRSGTTHCGRNGAKSRSCRTVKPGE